MFARNIIGVLLMSCFLIPAVQAQATDDIKGYFSEAAVEVKAEADFDRKREIISNSLQRMTIALGKVENSPLVSDEDRASLDGLRTALQEKQDELAGTNGFDPIANSQLNAFADYVVQSMEQADRTITVSVVTALLLLIIVILLV